MFKCFKRPHCIRNTAQRAFLGVVLSLIATSASQAQTSDVYKRWAVIEHPEFCIVGTVAGSNEARLFIDSAERLVLSFQLGGLTLPKGALRIALKIDDRAWAFPDAFGEGQVVLVAIPGNTTGPEFIRALLDGATLDLVSNLGVSAASFSLAGSGQAIRAFHTCNSKGGGS